MKKRVQLALALTEKSYWDKAAFPEINMEVNPFQNVFDKYLTFAPSKTLLEVGCGGGGFLALIAKKYKYKIFGVDYSESMELTRAVFKREGLIEPTLFKVDFFNWEPNLTFDVVCSFGFFEHFSNLSYVLAKHAKLVAPGGLMIVTVPNFGRAQFLLRSIIDYESLKGHNTSIMNLKAFRNALGKLPFKIEMLRYCQTFGFWLENKNPGKLTQFFNNLVLKAGGGMIKLFGEDWGNSMFSPHIVCVARRWMT